MIEIYATCTAIMMLLSIVEYTYSKMIPAPIHIKY